MSMMTVPSLAPGARTLPGELRVPGGNAWGWHRLHQNLAPLTEPPTIDPRIALSGLGEFCDDSGICYPDVSGGSYLDPGTIQNTIDQLPVGPQGVYTGPLVVYSATPTGGTTSQSMTPAQLTALINAGSNDLTRVLAITQGGSVLANGSIIGSQQAAALAANQAALNVSTAGLSGLLSSPMVPMAIIAVVAVLVLKGR